jgi:hypothetical protein
LTSSPSFVFALTLFHSEHQAATNTRQASPKPKYQIDLSESLYTKRMTGSWSDDTKSLTALAPPPDIVLGSKSGKMFFSPETRPFSRSVCATVMKVLPAKNEMNCKNDNPIDMSASARIVWAAIVGPPKTAPSPRPVMICSESVLYFLEAVRKKGKT